MSSVRRHTRYPINLRLRLRLPSGEVETVTEEVSLEGFSAPCGHVVALGTRFEFVMHLPDDTEIEGVATALRTAPEGATGFSSEFNPLRAADWETFLSQEKSSGGVWRMISRYVSSGGQHRDDARAVTHKGHVLKALEGTKAADEAMVVRLHMVGENGEAYRVAFEKHPSDKPEVSPYAKANPKLLELARRTVTRLLTEDVLLKRSPRSPVVRARLAELTRGGYGYVSVLPSGQPGLLGLQGSEFIGTEADGKPVFPFFDEGELERIASDTFRRDPDLARRDVPAAAPAPLVGEERFSAAYAHTRLDSRSPDALTREQFLAAMAASGRVQTRIYNGRSVRLYPDLWIEVGRPSSWPAPARGFAMHDGNAACVFVMVGPNAPCVVRVEPSDELTLIRGGRHG